MRVRNAVFSAESLKTKRRRKITTDLHVANSFEAPGRRQAHSDGQEWEAVEAAGEKAFLSR